MPFILSFVTGAITFLAFLLFFWPKGPVLIEQDFLKALHLCRERIEQGKPFDASDLTLLSVPNSQRHLKRRKYDLFEEYQLNNSLFKITRKSHPNQNGPAYELCEIHVIDEGYPISKQMQAEIIRLFLIEKYKALQTGDYDEDSMVNNDLYPLILLHFRSKKPSVNQCRSIVTLAFDVSGDTVKVFVGEQALHPCGQKRQDSKA
jgi:hypothetical protein